MARIIVICTIRMMVTSELVIKSDLLALDNETFGKRTTLLRRDTPSTVFRYQG